MSGELQIDGDPQFSDVPECFKMSLRGLHVRTRPLPRVQPPEPYTMKIPEFNYYGTRLIYDHEEADAVKVEGDPHASRVVCGAGDDCVCRHYAPDARGVVYNYRLNGTSVSHVDVTLYCLLCELAHYKIAAKLTAFQDRRNVNGFRIAPDDKGVVGIPPVLCIPIGAMCINGLVPDDGKLGIVHDPGQRRLLFTNLMDANVPSIPTCLRVLLPTGEDLPWHIFPSEPQDGSISTYTGGYFSDGIPRVRSSVWFESDHEGRVYANVITPLHILASHGIFFESPDESIWPIIRQAYDIYSSQPPYIREHIEAVINMFVPFLYHCNGVMFATTEDAIAAVGEAEYYRICPHPIFTISPSMLPVVVCSRKETRIAATNGTYWRYLRDKIRLSRAAIRVFEGTIRMLLTKPARSLISRVIRNTALCFLLHPSPSASSAMPMDKRLAIYHYVFNIPTDYDKLIAWVGLHPNFIFALFYYLRIISTRANSVEWRYCMTNECEVIDSFLERIPLVVDPILMGNIAASEALCSQLTAPVGRASQFTYVTTDSIVLRQNFWGADPSRFKAYIPPVFFYCTTCRGPASHVHWCDQYARDPFENPRILSVRQRRNLKKLRKAASAEAHGSLPKTHGAIYPRYRFSGAKHVRFTMPPGGIITPDYKPVAHCSKCSTVLQRYQFEDAIMMIPRGSRDRTVPMAAIGSCASCSRFVELQHAFFDGALQCGCNDIMPVRLKCLHCDKMTTQGTLYVTGPRFEYVYLCSAHSKESGRLVRPNHFPGRAAWSLTASEAKAEFILRNNHRKIGRPRRKQT